MILLVLLPDYGCSHKYDSNTLDLGFYQWNMWPDAEASADGSSPAATMAPSCGWEDFHRGTGKLVRIPAVAGDHFLEDVPLEVVWFHCRFTLPEMWEHRQIGLNFEGISGAAEVFLNGELVGSNRMSHGPDGPEGGPPTEGTPSSEGDPSHEKSPSSEGDPSHEKSPSVEKSPLKIDISETVYYTRDNHLVVRISGSGKGEAGLTGNVLVISVVPPAH